jgi:hypothetical protein
LASDAERLGLAQSRAVATVEACPTVLGSWTRFLNLRILESSVPNLEKESKTAQILKPNETFEERQSEWKQRNLAIPIGASGGSGGEDWEEEWEKEDSNCRSSTHAATVIR